MSNKSLYSLIQNQIDHLYESSDQNSIYYSDLKIIIDVERLSKEKEEVEKRKREEEERKAAEENERLIKEEERLSKEKEEVEKRKREEEERKAAEVEERLRKEEERKAVEEAKRLRIEKEKIAKDVEILRKEKEEVERLMGEEERKLANEVERLRIEKEKNVKDVERLRKEKEEVEKLKREEEERKAAKESERLILEEEKRLKREEGRLRIENKVRKNKKREQRIKGQDNKWKNKQKIEELNLNWNQKVKTFENMGLKEKLLQGIYSNGFQKPSLIQRRVIMPFIKGKDIIVQSPFGTGKTGAFSIGVLQRIDTTNDECQALILSPIHELVQQLQRVIVDLGNYLNVKCHSCVGGSLDIQALQNGVHVLVGTPDHIWNMIKRNALNLNKIKLFICDEADETLSISKEQIYDIFKLLPEDVQVGFFSTLMDESVLDISRQMMNNPITIVLQDESVIRQSFFIDVKKEEWKLDTLCDLFDTLGLTQVVIFCNTKKKVQYLTKQMRKRDFVVSAIHSEVSPFEREIILKGFYSGLSRVLISTDFLVRGIDFSKVYVVINYDLPMNFDKYFYRIRGAGFGRKCFAFNFATENDRNTLKQIESYFNIQIDEMPNNVAELL